MKAGTTVKLKTATLVALVLFLVHAACTGNGMTSQVDPPTVAGKEQNDIAVVDAGNDGTPDDTDVNNTTATGTVPVEAARAEANGIVVTKERDADSDGVGVTCTHDLSGAQASNTECIGVTRAEFPIATESGPVEFDVAFFSSSPDSGAAELTEQIDVAIAIDCGDAVETADLSLTTVQQALLSATIGSGAVACALEVTLINFRVISTGLATRVVQGVRVTARNLAPIQCADGSQCPLDLRFCNQNGFCQSGLEGQTCAIASLGCSTPLCLASQCNDGDAGSPVPDAFFCADGYGYDGAECVGEPCASDADCLDAVRPICTFGAGCSKTGATSDGCLTDDGCASGACVLNVCTDIVGQGEVCSVIDTLCGAGLICFDNGTCQVPLPLGAACNANDECENGPPFGNSCIGGFCTARSGIGGVCDPGDDPDCLPGGLCGATDTCELTIP